MALGTGFNPGGTTDKTEKRTAYLKSGYGGDATIEWNPDDPLPDAYAWAPQPASGASGTATSTQTYDDGSSYGGTRSYAPTYTGNPYASAGGHPNLSASMSLNPFEQQQAILNQQAYLDRQRLEEQAKAASSTEKSRLKAIQGLLAQGQSQFNAPDAIQYDPAQQAAARAAAFGQAKDQAGQIAASAIKGLQDTMASRGIQGSTIEMEGMQQALASPYAALQDVNLQQAINDITQSREIADLQYQGGITQRGQDISANQALLSLIQSAMGALY